MTEWHALIPLIVPVVIGILKLLVPRIPKVWLPILAPVLGAFAEVIINTTQGVHGPPWLGPALGAAGVGVREIADQVRKRLSSQ